MTDEKEKANEAVLLMSRMLAPEWQERARSMTQHLAEILPAKFAGVDERVLFALYCAGMKDHAENCLNSWGMQHEVIVSVMASTLSGMTDEVGMDTKQLDAILARQRAAKGAGNDQPQH